MADRPLIDKLNLQSECLRMRLNGLGYSEIAEKLSALAPDGVTVGKSSVGRWLRDNEDLIDATRKANTKQVVREWVITNIPKVTEIMKEQLDFNYELWINTRDGLKNPSLQFINSKVPSDLSTFQSIDSSLMAKCQVMLRLTGADTGEIADALDPVDLSRFRKRVEGVVADALDQVKKDACNEG